VVLVKSNRYQIFFWISEIVYFEAVVLRVGNISNFCGDGSSELHVEGNANDE